MSVVSNAKATKKKPTVKKPKDPNAPKPPLTPYLRFGAQQRAVDATLNALPVGQQGKVLAEMWAKMSEEGKSSLKMAYEKDRKEYDEKLEEYKKTEEYKKYQEQLKSLGVLKEKKTKKQSAYNVFYKEQYGEISKEKKGLDMKEITAIIVKNWREIDEKTKKTYADKAAKINEANKENKKAQVDDE